MSLTQPTMPDWVENGVEGCGNAQEDQQLGMYCVGERFCVELGPDDLPVCVGDGGTCSAEEETRWDR